MKIHHQEISLTKGTNSKLRRDIYLKEQLTATHSNKLLYLVSYIILGRS